MTGGLELTAGEAAVVVDLAHGARLASLTVAGYELLVGPPGAPIAWGCYPMAPWAGRVRNGRFPLDGSVHQLPIDAPPHAIHGTAYTSAWTLDRVDLDQGEATMTLVLGSPWPVPCQVDQRVVLAPDRLRLELALTPRAGRAMPAMVGWHPWFRRHLARPGDPDGAGAELDLDAASMYELDAEAIPTGRLQPPGPPPWDNCFTDLARNPVIRWPGRMELELASSCRHWVVYTHPDHALCVEPQTDAPDAFNRQPCLLGPGGNVSAWFELRWRLP